MLFFLDFEGTKKKAKEKKGVFIYNMITLNKIKLIFTPKERCK